ncbi:MAG: phenylhydantoinase [Peptococcaceae bacterium BRH_c4a]|nr:MAG: phenylhydantoinase [Peptococcaceae bacterium BRH_c4a]
MSTVIKNGTVVTASDIYSADILIEGEKIVAVGQNLKGDKIIDAAGKYVFPGGVDGHTHLELPVSGTVSAAWDTETVAAAVGGTTTIVDFAIQGSGGSLADAVKIWREHKAEGKAAVDYGLHVAIGDLTESVLNEIPSIVSSGVPSLKLFMAYKGTLMADDSTLLRTLKKAGECGALVCVHCENGDVIDVLSGQLVSQGKTEPKYHAESRPPEVEAEATGRAIALAEMAGAPIFIVHLSTALALEKVKAAREKGQPVYAETCPHYLLLSVENYDRPDFQGAKYVCSPPLRQQWNQEELWLGLSNGDLQVVGSDHCAFNWKGQKELGRDDFRKIPNGGPGIENRLTLLYTYGVNTGRITLNKFVDLMATAPAKLLGLYPQKGTIAVGGDADLLIFDPEAEGEISAKTQKQDIDYNAFEGLKYKGASETVLLRGQLIVDKGRFVGKIGGGRFIPRKPFQRF